MRLGIDIGSTTVKLVLLDSENEIIFSRYERHMANIFSKVEELMDQLVKELEKDSEISDEHIGIQNVNQRIRLLFGDHYGIKIESSQSRGTSVKILFPCVK